MLLERSPARAVFAVAWPVAAIGLLRTGLLLTDSYWVGQLGEAALTGLGASAFGWWMMVTVGKLPATGVHALVAQHEGAGRRDLVVSTAGQGLWGSVFAALALLLCIPFVGMYLDAIGLGADSAARPQGQAFLLASLLGGATVSANAVIAGVFQGLGHTRTALAITAIAFGANALLDPLFIFTLGIAGAAWATTIANAVGAVVGLAILRSRGLTPVLTRPRVDVLRRIVAIGGPVSGRSIAFSMVYVLLGRIIVQFGEHHLAALGVGHRVEGLAYMVCVAFEVAAATMVGQHFGAGDPAKARRSADAAALWCAAAMVPITMLLWVVARPLFGWFADDTAIVDAGVVYLRIQLLVLVFMALESAYSGAFAGLGRTVPPFWIVTVGTFIRLPLAWVLAYPLGMGIEGVWWAIASTTLARGIVTAIWLRRTVP